MKDDIDDDRYTFIIHMIEKEEKAFQELLKYWKFKKRTDGFRNMLRYCVQEMRDGKLSKEIW